MFKQCPSLQIKLTVKDLLKREFNHSCHSYGLERLKGRLDCLACLNPRSLCGKTL